MCDLNHEDKKVYGCGECGETMTKPLVYTGTREAITFETC